MFMYDDFNFSHSFILQNRAKKYLHCYLMKDEIPGYTPQPIMA